MKFDIAAARGAGYSDDEIADYLAKESKFDLSGALQSGYTPSDVIDFLSKPTSGRQELAAGSTPSEGRSATPMGEPDPRLITEAQPAPAPAPVVSRSPSPPTPARGPSLPAPVDPLGLISGKPTGAPGESKGLIRTITDTLRSGPKPSVLESYNPATAAASGTTMPVSQQYVDNLRAEIGTLPLEQRMAALEAMAKEPGIKGAGAQALLYQVRRENQTDPIGRMQDEALFRSSKNAPKGAPASSNSLKLGSTPPKSVVIPDITPTIRDMDEGATAKDIAERRAFASTMTESRAESERTDPNSTSAKMARARTAEEFRGIGDLAADSILSLSQGVVGIPQLVTNIVSPGSKLADTLRGLQKEFQAGESEISRASQGALRDRIENESGFIDKYAATVASMITNPTLGINEGIKQLPNFLAIIGVARATGLVAGGTVSLAGRASPTLALGEAISGGAVRAGAQSLGSTTGGVVTSMGMAAGDAAGNVYERLIDPKQTPVSVWEKNPDYQILVKQRTKELMAQGLEDWDAEKQASKEAIKEIATAKARMAALVAAPAGLLGYMGAESAIVSRGLAGAVAQQFGVKAAAKTFAKDNLGEQVEEGLTQGAGNIVARTVDPSVNLTEGVAQAMGTAAVTSAPFSALGAAAKLTPPRQQTDGIVDRYVRSVLDPNASDPTLINPADTARAPANAAPAERVEPTLAPGGIVAGAQGGARVEPTLDPGVTNFTPPGSPTDLAGLNPIVVPNVPAIPEVQAEGLINAETERAFGLDTLRMGGTNVSTGGNAGAATSVGGVAAGDQSGGGVGVSGPALAGAEQQQGAGAGTAAANAQPAVPVGGGAGQQSAGLRAGYTVPNAPIEQWFGRKGDGYTTKSDAEQALPGRQRMFPGLEWRVDQMPNGKFRIAGYSQEITSGTQAPQAQQTETQGQQAAGAGVAATQTGAAAETPAADVPNSELPRLRAAPQVPQTKFQIFQQAAAETGHEIESLRFSDFSNPQKVASAIARMLGKTFSVARVVSGDPSTFSNGMINRLGGEHIVVSETSEDSAIFVAIHEAYHGLPGAQRKQLNTALLKLFRQDNKQQFLEQFNYNEAEFDEEAPAYMAQVISKRADFWEELRTKMGNREFADVAKVILTKLNEILTGAREEYGDDFAKKYITDIAKARDLLTSAYADAMRAQGLKPDADVTGGVTSSNRSRVGMDFKDVVKRTPELQAAAEKVKSGEMTAEEYDRLVNEAKPVEAYATVPQPATVQEIRGALTSDKIDRIGVPSRTLKAGDPVGLRLDIPAYSNHGTWVVSVHEQEAGYNAGKSIGYEPVASATNVTFGVVEKAALNIAGGKPKSTIAVIKGGWKPTTAAEAKVKADQALKSKSWVQVGMDPERHSYFYDRATMQPVTAADEVIQVGPLVLAKNPTYGKKSEFMFSRRSRPGQQVAEINGRPYDSKIDNFRAPSTDSFLPRELVQRARDLIDRLSVEAPPVELSAEDRARAEALLQPVLDRAASVKAEYDQKVIDIVERTGALGQMLAKIKGMKRAAEKLAIEEKFKVENIRDTLRSTIIVPSYEDAQAVIDEVYREFEVMKDRVKNRTLVKLNAPDIVGKTGPLPSGYSDVLINVMINGVPAEIQINVPEMLAAKGEEGHKLYEIERSQPEGSPIRKQVEAAQAEYYADASRAAAERNSASESGMGSANGGQDLVGTSSLPRSKKGLPSKTTTSEPLSSSKNLQPAGNLGGTLIELPPDAVSISQELSLFEDKNGRLFVEGDAARIRQLTSKIAVGTVVDGGMRFKPADAEAVKKAIANAPKTDPVIARDIGRTLGLSAEELASTSLEYQTGESKDRAFFAPLKGGIPDVVKFLEDRRRASGLELLDISNPEHQDTIAKLMAAETLAAIRSSGNALEWYDETIAKTLAMAAVKYPELSNDANAQMVFRLAMAITSQGLNVENNLGFTMRQYDAFRQQGKFPEAGEGESGEAMVGNFKLINDLLSEMGPDLMRRFLVTEFTVGELKDAGFDPSGELIDEKVLGSSVLGPKIGFGFYSNLNGNFEPVTMDMWFMRTIGRLTGNLRSFDAKKFSGQVSRLRESLDERGADAIYADQFDADLVERARTDNDAAIELARQVKKAHEKDFRNNRAAFDAGDRKKSKLVFAADTIIQSVDKPKDVPGSGMERRLLREVVRKAVAQVEQAYGQRIPPAAMQALIWYPEQELYKAMGVKLSVTSQDYAGAAEKVLTEEGYDAKRLRAAAKSGSDRVRQANGNNVGRAAQGNGQAAGATGPLQGTERERFLRERYERTQLQLERVTPRRKGIIFEVAPDPNNESLSNAWRSLTKEQRLDISNRVAREIVPRVLDQLDTDGIVVSQVGSYLDDTNPSFSLLLEKGDPVEFAKILGFVLAQDSMMVVSPNSFKGGSEVGAVLIEVGEKTDAEIKEIYDTLRGIEVKGERPIGGQSYANGAMTVLNFSDVPTQQLAILIDQKLNKSYTVLTRGVFAAFPEKKEYDYASQANDGRGSRAILRQRARDLRAEATAALERELDAAGIRRSNRGRTNAAAETEGSAQEVGKPIYTHEVVDPRTGRVMGEYQSVEAARRGRDRFDNKFGAYRYKVRKVDTGEVRMSNRVSLAEDAARQEQFLQSKAEEAGYATVDEFVDQDYEGFVAAAAQWREENPADVMYSRRAETKRAYEQRIDELFDGSRPSRTGIKVLDNSDMLSLLGYRNTPVYLQESKVIQGQDNHPNMKANVWKKIPDWMDNPAAVFDSDTVDGRLVFVAPELVDGSLVLLVIEPDTQISGSLKASLLVNAYDKDGANPPVSRWMREGKMRYMDQKEFPVVLLRAGLQLPRKETRNAPGTKRILTEKQLGGYKKANSGEFTTVMRSARAQPNQSQSEADLTSIFKDLENARGLKLVRVKERAAEHPMATNIEYVNDNFYDILESLDDAGLIKINCK